MNIHMALYKWKQGTQPKTITEALLKIESLKKKVPGIIEINTGPNTSKYNEGYTHVIFVKGRNQQAIDDYRTHPDHDVGARMIDEIEEHGIGVDLQIN